MNLYFEDINSALFLICQMGEEEILDEFSYEMLSNNDIDDILPVSFTQRNSERFLKYNVSTYTTLEKFFEGTVGRQKVVNALLNITSALSEAEEYMIDPSIFILEQNHIFVDLYNNKVNLVCVPIVGYKSPQTPLEFFKNIIFSIKYDENDDSNYVTNIINYLNSSTNFSITEFKKILQKINYDSNGNSGNNTASINNGTSTSSISRINNSASTSNTAQANNGASHISTSPINNGTSVKNADSRKESLNSQAVIVKRNESIAVNPNKELKPVKSENSHANERKLSASAAPNNVSSEKKMSIFYLLAHYSAENKALYQMQKEQGSNTDVKQPAVQNVPISAPVTDIQQNSRYENKEVKVPKNEVTSRPINYGNTTSKQNFGNTVDLTHRKMTTVLSQMPLPTQTSQNQAVFIRNKNNEQAVINHFPFKIGASVDGNVDYAVRGNTNISQIHAIVDYKDGNYVLIDNNSTNGTYINANKIEANKPINLVSGNFIRLADEDFKFEIR